MGLQALEAMFAASAAEGRAAFLPYYPVGYPNMARSLDALVAMAQAGVDGFEIGIPLQRPRWRTGPPYRQRRSARLSKGQPCGTACKRYSSCAIVV